MKVNSSSSLGYAPRLVKVCGGINSLMAEVLEDHIRLHLLSSDKSSVSPSELAEDLIDLVRAYLK